MCILYSTFNIQHSTFNINIKQNMTTFQDKVKALRAHHEELLSRKNEPVEWGNGIYEKYKNPILTAEHTPL